MAARRYVSRVHWAASRVNLIEIWESMTLTDNYDIAAQALFMVRKQYESFLRRSR
jgi:hypothetical protein